MIGVYGGTFDPPHLGHVHLIKSLLSQFGFSKLYLVPTSQNPLKTRGPHISPEDRFLLLQAAMLEVDPRITILDWEIKRNGPSFTIDTIDSLLKIENGPLHLIIGNELLSQLPSWKSIDELFKKVNWIVVNRTHQSHLEIMQNLQQLLHTFGIIDSHFTSEKCIAYRQDQRLIQLCEINALPISSTEIRNKLGELWKKNTLENPPQGIQRSVWLLIKEKRLYSVG